MTFGKIFGWLAAVAIAAFVFNLFSTIIQGGAERRAALEKQETAARYQREAAEKAEQEKNQAEITAAKVKAEKIALCNTNMPTFAKEIQQAKDNGRCLANTKLTPPRMCALHDRESEMCMGDEAGLVCKVSPKGAEGCFQFMPDTCHGAVVTNKKGKKVKLPGVCVDGNGDGKIKANSFADSSLSAVYYLCALEKKVGSDNMFKAYNGGSEGYLRAITDTTAYATWIEERALTYAQGSNPASNSAMASTNQPATTSAGTPKPSGLDSPELIPVAAMPSMFVTIGRTSRAAYPIIVGHGCTTSIEEEDRGGGRLHKGWDNAAEIEEPVIAAYDGIVEYAGWNHSTEAGERAGNHLRVRYHSDTKKPGEMSHEGFMHLLRFNNLKAGDSVRQGQVVAFVGKTGVHNSGSHLHTQVEEWTEGGKTRIVENPFKFFDGSAYDPSSSLFKGSSIASCAGYAEKFRKLLAKR